MFKIKLYPLKIVDVSDFRKERCVILQYFLFVLRNERIERKQTDSRRFFLDKKFINRLQP